MVLHSIESGVDQASPATRWRRITEMFTCPRGAVLAQASNGGVQLSAHQPWDLNQLWELTPSGQMINQASGQQLQFDGDKLVTVHFDDSDPAQSLEGRQWDIHPANSAMHKPAAGHMMRYVCLVVQQLPGAEVVLRAVVTVEQFTDQVYVRLRGRSFSLKINSTTTGVEWRLGTPRVDIRPDGRR